MESEYSETATLATVEGAHMMTVYTRLFVNMSVEDRADFVCLADALRSMNPADAINIPTNSVDANDLCRISSMQQPNGDPSGNPPVPPTSPHASTLSQLGEASTSAAASVQLVATEQSREERKASKEAAKRAKKKKAASEEEKKEKKKRHEARATAAADASKEKEKAGKSSEENDGVFSPCSMYYPSAHQFSHSLILSIQLQN
jgi:type IV secretory pathway VirB10-like protein